MAEETKKEFTEIPVKFDQNEHAWLKTQAAERNKPINLIVRECVFKAMTDEINAELAPIAPPTRATVVEAKSATQSAAKGDVKGDLFDFYSWLGNQTHDVGARELFRITKTYFDGQSIPARAPVPQTAFGG